MSSSSSPSTATAAGGQSFLLAVSAPPFWHCGRTVRRSMQYTLLALLPAAIMALYHWGVPAMRVMALSMAVCVATEALFTRIMGRRQEVDNYYALIVGLLFAFLLPASAPWWLVTFGAFISMSIGCLAFGGLGSSPLSPPLVGWAALLVSWPLLMDPNTIELSTTLVDPLVRLKFFGSSTDISTLDLAFGFQLGALGASQVAALALGGVFLCATGVIRWEISLAFLVGVVSIGAAFFMIDPQSYASPVFHLATGSTILAAFFLATENSCSPNRPIPMALYGFLGGALVILIRSFGEYLDGAPFAVLLINLLMPHLEHIRPKPFGGR